MRFSVPAVVASMVALSFAARAQDANAGGASLAAAHGADASGPQLSDAAAPSSTPSAESPRASSGVQPDGLPSEPAEKPHIDEAACAPTAAVCVRNGGFALWPRVRLRTGYEYVVPDDQLLFVGRNDGFFADQMRIGVDGSFRTSVRFRFILDATSLLPASTPAVVSPTLAAMRDAWVAWTWSPFFILSAGQQFMPADVEGTTTAVMLPFARRSVAAVGVRAGQGYAVSGLSPTRQLGVVLGTGGPFGGDKPRLGDFSLEYKLAVSNGNGQNLLGNDNKMPALYARIGAGLADAVMVGVGGRFNPRTVGAAPNFYNETDAVGFADLTVRVVGIELVALGIVRATGLDTLVPDGTSGAGQETGFGGTAWLWLKRPFDMDLHGVQPAYRISYLDPSSAFVTDQLLEHSVGVRWDVPMDELRLAVFMDYTTLVELGDGVRNLANDRVTALVQLEL